MTGIGSTIGTYKITEKIGEGGMGAVFRGVDQMLEREVAIKMLRPELARQPEVLERFRSEAVTLAKLNHPNIATLYNFLHHEGDYFMVMEFVHGHTVESIIQNFGAIAYERAIPLFCQALEGIEQAHKKGIIHRDLKPANIMIVDSRIVKVMDFGIARMLGSARLTRQGNVVGTIEYMSPEAIRGEDVDARSDIYSLGILLYEMLTGRLPFENTSEYELMRSQIEEAPPPPTVYLPDMPLAIEQAIMRSLAKRREARFQTAGEFRAVLLSSLVSSTSGLGNTTANYAAPATRMAEAMQNKADNLKSGTQAVNTPQTPPTGSNRPPTPVPPPAQTASTQKFDPSSPSQETRQPTPLPTPPPTPLHGTQALGSQNLNPNFPASQVSQALPAGQANQMPQGTQAVPRTAGQSNPFQAGIRSDSGNALPAYQPGMPPVQAQPASGKSNWKLFAGAGVLLLALIAAPTAYFLNKAKKPAPPPVETQSVESPAEPAAEQNTNPAPETAPPADQNPAISNTTPGASGQDNAANGNANTSTTTVKRQRRNDNTAETPTAEEPKAAEAPPQPPPQPETKPAPATTPQPEPTKDNPSTPVAKVPEKKDEKKKGGGIGGFFKKVFGGGDEKKDEKKKDEKKNP